MLEIYVQPILLFTFHDNGVKCDLNVSIVCCVVLKYTQFCNL